MEKWIEFLYNDHVLCSYTVRGTFPGELQATKELLAAEKAISPESITTRIVTK